MQYLSLPFRPAIDYDYLLGLDRQLLMWEWLRRDQSYQREYDPTATEHFSARQTTNPVFAFDQGCARRWGLMFPDRPRARCTARASGLERRVGGTATAFRN